MFSSRGGAPPPDNTPPIQLDFLLDRGPGPPCQIPTANQVVPKRFHWLSKKEQLGRGALVGRRGTPSHQRRSNRYSLSGMSVCKAQQVNAFIHEFAIPPVWQSRRARSLTGPREPSRVRRSIDTRSAYQFRAQLLIKEISRRTELVSQAGILITAGGTPTLSSAHS